ncbi:MAG TPA: hypothetical protein VK181_07405, partial [Rhizobium sp.]|nr:hypothetical protein [Rhizobium sp.]
MPLRAAKKLLSRSGTQPASGAIVRTGDGTSKALRLSWVWTTHSHPDCNLGDALSPVVVSALCGLPVQRAAFGANMERLA